MSLQDSPQTSASEAHYPIQDLKVLAPMADVLPEDQMGLIIQSCLEDAIERTLQIEKEAQTRDWAQIQKYAHDIKSMAGQIGAARLQYLATALEDHCKSGETGECEDMIVALAYAASATKEAYPLTDLASIIKQAKSLA